MDINSLLSGLMGSLGSSDAAIAGQQKHSAQTTADIAGSADLMNAQIQKSIALADQAAKQTAEIERQKAMVGEAAQRTANLDPDNLNNAFVQTMAQLTTTKAAREAAMAEYRGLTETGFLDNPVGYLFNQLALPQVVQTHNNLAVQQDNLTSDLQTRTALLAQNKSTVTANVANATKDAQLMAAAANEASAQAKAEQVRMDNFGKISTARMNELALTDKFVQNASTRFSAGMQMANFQAMQAERAEARAERNERRAAAAKDKAEKDAQDGALAAGLARVSGALGYPAPVTLDDFKRMPASTTKQKLYNAAVEGTYGDDLAGSIGFLRGGNIPRMQQNDPAFVKGLGAISAGVKSYSTAASRAAEKSGAKLKDEDAAAQGALDYTVAVSTAAHDPKAAAPVNDARWDTTFNPYRSQDATMLALVKQGNMPKLANNSYVKVLETVAAAMPPGIPEFRGEDKTHAIQALAEMVRTRTISVQQAAADLVTYTRTAANYNQQTLKLASLNMPVQESAYVRVPGMSALATPVVGDTMSVAGAENLLINLAISKARGLSRVPGFGGIEAVAKKELLDINPTK